MIPILFKDEDYLIQLLEDGNSNILEDGNSKMLMLGMTPIGFQSHGLGVLSDTISAEVEEERNGSYELTMEYPISGVHFSEIGLRSIIVAKPNYLDPPQPFRVYQITKPINGKCTIYARHLSYDLSDIPVQPFTATGIQSALNGLISNAMYDVSEWTLATSRATDSTFTVDVPSSIRSWFGGKAGSLLDVYGGEWHYTGRTCRLENSRGEDRGVTIRYGVNLTELKQEENCASCYTGVLAYWTDQDGNVVQGSVQNVSGTYDYIKVYTLDCSEDYEEAPTTTQLNEKAAAYIENNNIGVPKVNLTLNFVMLQGLLNRVDLCDTVRVIFEKLGVEATAKCIRVRWNVLLDRYEEAEFGDAQTTITDSIIQANTSAMEQAKALRSTQTILQNAIDDAVRKVTGNLGGYVILHDTNDDGYPDELLIMDTDDITTATNVWRWNQQGLMHASSYTGTYANAAITMDGQIVADAITTGTLRGIEIISDDNAGNTIDLVHGTVTVQTTDGLGGKARMHSRYFQVLTDEDSMLAQLAATWTSTTPQEWYGGALILYDKDQVRRFLAGIDGLRYYDSTGENLLASLTSGDTGGTWRTYWNDGSVKIYLGTLTQQGLLNDTPSLAFSESNGDGTSTMKSWYSLNRAFISDESNEDSSKWEYGYVAHGHTSAHTYTFGYATTGEGDTFQAYLWCYVDGESLGYIPITSSDARFKTGVTPISERYKAAVSQVELDSFYFDFTSPVKSEANNVLRFGAIAQDLIAAMESEGIDPTESDLVMTVDDVDGERYAINYTSFLVARLAAAEDRIKTLEERLERLEARLGAE